MITQTVRATCSEAGKVELEFVTEAHIDGASGYQAETVELTMDELGEFGEMVAGKEYPVEDWPGIEDFLPQP